MPPIVEPTSASPVAAGSSGARSSAATVVVARRPRWHAIAAAVSAVTVATALVSWVRAGHQVACADVPLTTQEPIAPRVAVSVHEVAPIRTSRDETRMQARYPVPRVGDAFLDETFPSLRGWIHPVTASDELVPSFYARLFGAERVGVERVECGSGHCGIDLDGPRGRPLVAVAAGTVIRVERSDQGADGRSGHYVRIQHQDGTLTSYMHMDDVAADLQPGTYVNAGQYVGTLGATAVYSAPPHLHFSLEVPNQLAARRDHANTHFVDPAPFLARSRIVPAINRREPKPAS